MFQHWSGWNWLFLVLFTIFWRRSSSETLFPRPSARSRFLALSQQAWSTSLKLFNISDLPRRAQPLVKAHAVSRQSVCLQSLPLAPGWQESPKIGCRAVSHAGLHVLLILLSPFCNKLARSARIILPCVVWLSPLEEARETISIPIAKLESETVSAVFSCLRMLVATCDEWKCCT